MTRSDTDVRSPTLERGTGGKKRSVYFITQAESATFTLFPFFEALVRSKVDIPGRCLAADELKAIFR